MKNKKMISLVIIALIIALVLTTLMINRKTVVSNSIDIANVNEVVSEIQNTSDDLTNTIENSIDEANIIPENIVVDNNINTTQEADIIKQEVVKKETPKQTTISIQEKKVESPKQTEQPNTTSTTKQEPIQKSTPKQVIQVEEQAKEETIIEEKEPEIPKCTDTKHGIGIGNSNKWFNSKQEAITYYDNIIKTWGDKWTSYEIDSETYYKNCPDGYEVFSCPYCGKWTINLFY